MTSNQCERSGGLGAQPSVAQSTVPLCKLRAAARIRRFWPRIIGNQRRCGALTGVRMLRSNGVRVRRNALGLVVS
jgi:hypothetical protein